MTTFQDGELTADNGSRIFLGCDIKAVKEVEGICVVILEVPPDESMTENVVGVSAEDGKRLWQIERIVSTGTNPANCYLEFMPSERPHCVGLWNWSSWFVEIDVRNGRVVAQAQRK